MRITWFSFTAVLLVVTTCPVLLRAQSESGAKPPRQALAAAKIPPVPVARETASHSYFHRRFWVATLTGASAGAVLGALATPMAGVPAGQVGAHRVRAGFTYGLMGGALAGALALRGTPAEDDSRSFWKGRLNTTLLVGMAASQVLDYTSTRYFRDRGMDEWLLTNRLVDNRGAFIATEVTALASATALAWIFHHTGHYRLERFFEAGYITLGVTSGVANYRYPTVGHALF